MCRFACFCCSFLLTALLAATLSAQQVGVSWRHDLEAAKAEAAQSGRLVLVHFWTPTCGPCRRLETSVFNQPTVATSIEERFVPVKLNADEFPAVAQGYGITRVPTDVVITPQNEVVGTLISPGTPTAYVSELVQVANQFQSRSGAAYQLAAATAPVQSKINPAYAGLKIGFTLNRRS